MRVVSFELKCCFFHLSFSIVCVDTAVDDCVKEVQVMSEVGVIVWWRCEECAIDGWVKGGVGRERRICRSGQ